MMLHTVRIEAVLYNYIVKAVVLHSWAKLVFSKTVENIGRRTINGGFEDATTRKLFANVSIEGDFIPSLMI